MPTDAMQRYIELACRLHRRALDEASVAQDEVTVQLSEFVTVLDDDDRVLAAALSQALTRLRAPDDAGAPAAVPDDAVASAITAAADGTPDEEFMALNTIAATMPLAAFAVRAADVCARVGSPLAAHQFYRFAHERNPHDPYVALCAVQTRYDSDPSAAGTDAIAVLRGDGDAIDVHRLDQMHAGTALLLLATICEAADSVDACAGLAAAAERAHMRLTPVEARELGSLPWRLGGYCHECAGDGALAAKRYVQGISRFPNELDLYERAGTLLFTVEATRGPAATLLSRAIDLGSRSVWPRYFLAYTLLAADDFTAALEHLNAARRIAPDVPALQSCLYELSAICLARGGYPADTVNTLFERASELANEAGEQPDHLLHNRSAFDTRGDGRPQWRIELCETARSHQVSATPFRVSGSASGRTSPGSAVASAARG